MVDKRETWIHPKEAIEKIMKEKYIKGKIIFAMAAGSFCYNLNNEGSDVDYMAVIEEPERKEIKGKPRKLKIYQHQPNDIQDYSIYEWKRFKKDILTRGMPLVVQMAFAYPFSEIKEREKYVYESKEWKDRTYKIFGKTTLKPYKDIKNWNTTTIPTPYMLKNLFQKNKQRELILKEKTEIFDKCVRLEYIRKSFRQGARKMPSLTLLKDPPTVKDRHCEQSKTSPFYIKSWNSTKSLHLGISYIRKELRRYDGFVEKQYSGMDISKFLYHAARWTFELERQCIGEFPLIYYPKGSLEREVLMHIRTYEPQTIYHEDILVKKVVAMMHQRVAFFKKVEQRWRLLEDDTSQE